MFCGPAGPFFTPSPWGRTKTGKGSLLSPGPESKADTPHTPSPKEQYVFLNSLPGPPGPVLCDDERGGAEGCSKPKQRQEEKSGRPPTPATLPRHVCEARFQRAPQERIRNPAPLTRSEVVVGASAGTKRPGGRELSLPEEPASVLAATIFLEDATVHKDRGDSLILAWGRRAHRRGAATHWVPHTESLQAAPSGIILPWGQ